MAALHTKTSRRILRQAIVLGSGALVVGMGLMLSACAVSGPRQIVGYALGPRPSAPEQLTLLSWNVHRSGHPDLGEDLKQAVKTHDPDLLFLQEAQPGRTPALHVSGVLAPAWRSPLSKKGGTGVFTASREAPLECQAIRSRDREFGVTVPKATLVTRHALADGRSLLAVNVHALNFEHGKPNRFARQLQALHTVMDEHDGPMILAGDFNTWNPARDHHLRKVTESLRLREVATFTGKRKTGDQGSAVWNGMLGIDPSLPLDRIFYRDLAISSARVLDLDSSDHPPLLVTFHCQPDGKGRS